MLGPPAGPAECGPDGGKGVPAELVSEREMHDTLVILHRIELVDFAKNVEASHGTSGEGSLRVRRRRAIGSIADDNVGMVTWPSAFVHTRPVNREEQADLLG